MERETGIKHHVDAINRGGRHLARGWRRTIRDIIDRPVLPVVLVASLAIVGICAEVPSCADSSFKNSIISAPNQVVNPSFFDRLGQEIEKGRDLPTVPNGR